MIARVMSRCWEKESRLASGTPYAADNSNPLAQMPSNPASAASRADSGLCAAITVASPPAATLCRNAFAILCSFTDLNHTIVTPRKAGVQDK